MCRTPQRKASTKGEFGEKLHALMLQRGWNQSELARRTDLPRDAISTYVRGRSSPTPKSLEKLASAFEMSAGELLSDSIVDTISSEIPSFEMRVSPSAPNTAWIRVNRLVEFKTALRIAELVENDKYSPGMPHDTEE